jgi:glycosyltransferase involved in cell wall biosynthesis
MTPFSIIIPVYNEEEILQQNMEILVRHCDGLGTPYEILIVGNGSTDDSDKIGDSLSGQFSHVRYFSLPERGVGRAFKKGIAESGYDHLIFMDADLSADLSFIEKAGGMLEDHVLVLGAKIKGLQNRSFLRKMGSMVFYLSVRFIMGMKFVDYAPGAKGYRKSFLMEYFDYIDDYTSFVLKLTYLASVKRLPLVEVAIECDDRRKSRFNLWAEAISKFKGLFSLKLKKIMGKI